MGHIPYYYWYSFPYVSQKNLILSNIFKFYRLRNILKRPKDSQAGENVEYVMLVFQIVAYFVMVGLTTSLAFIGEQPLIEQRGSLFYVVLLQGLLMQHMTVHIMFNHATKEKYTPSENRLFVLVMCVCTVVNLFYEYLDVLKCVYMLILIVVVCNFHFIFNTVWEISHILGIRVFKVKPIG